MPASAKTKEIDDDDNTQTPDRSVFLVGCHHCGHEWIETWTRSRWFLRNGYNDTTESLSRGNPLTINSSITFGS
jgi:hypothetical protein